VARTLLCAMLFARWYRKRPRCNDQPRLYFVCVGFPGSWTPQLRVHLSALDSEDELAAFVGL
jgi:hypothetical protein